MCNQIKRWIFLFSMATALIIVSVSAVAENQSVDNTTITEILVNGGIDTENPGTTCFTVSSPVSATCNYGVVAIPNNNNQLLAAALIAKITGSKILLFYKNDASVPLHCPGVTVTPCSVISVFLK